jgi:hypothetical protein
VGEQFGQRVSNVVFMGECLLVIYWCFMMNLRGIMLICVCMGALDAVSYPSCSLRKSLWWEEREAPLIEWVARCQLFIISCITPPHIHAHTHTPCRYG